MTQLLLKVNQPYAYGYMEAGAMVTVRRLSDIEGRMTPWWTARQTVDVAGDTNGPRSEVVFELPGGGRYGITVTRPRATDFEREFLVKEGERRREAVVLEGSPHEYLGWQQFAGIIGPTASLRTASFGFAPAPEPQLSVVAVPKGRDAWALRVAPGMLAPVPTPDWPRQQDPEFTMWSASPPGNDGHALVDRLRQPDDPYRRDPLSVRYPRWIGVSVRRTEDVISIPWTWWGGTQNEREGLRIVHTRNRPNPIDPRATGHTVVTVLDSRWFALLEFLSSNRLGTAADLVDEVLTREGPDAAEMALYGKVKGPLVAVAGALALVIRTETHGPERWDRWLENLANWFEGIPDGPIILAYRRLSQATSKADLKKVYGWLRIGIGRGIPYFSATILMLVQSLAQLANDLPEAEQDRRFVASISSRVDPNQPFTVIHP